MSKNGIRRIPQLQACLLEANKMHAFLDKATPWARGPLAAAVLEVRKHISRVYVWCQSEALEHSMNRDIQRVE